MSSTLRAGGSGSLWVYSGTDETNGVDQVLAETDQQASNQNVQLLHSLQQQVMQLVQLQGGGLAEQDSCEPAKPAQG